MFVQFLRREKRLLSLIIGPSHSLLVLAKFLNVSLSNNYCSFFSSIICFLNLNMDFCLARLLAHNCFPASTISFIHLIRANLLTAYTSTIKKPLTLSPFLNYCTNLLLMVFVVLNCNGLLTFYKIDLNAFLLAINYLKEPRFSAAFLRGPAPVRCCFHCILMTSLIMFLN